LGLALGQGQVDAASPMEDDDGRLAGAEDKATALLAVLDQDGEHILPEIVERAPQLHLIGYDGVLAVRPNCM
jgi:hypothetical protein